MRILFLTPDMNGRSGWSRYVLDIGKALHAQGHEIHAVVTQESGHPWCTEHAILRPPTSYLNSTLLRAIDAVRVGRLLRRLRPDIVHVIAEPYALLVPATTSYRTCMTVHGTYAVLIFDYPKIAQRFAQAYRTYNCLISVSAFTKSYVRQLQPALFTEARLGEKITVLPNAIDLTRFPFTAQKKSSDIRRILSVSAVKEKKGYLSAIDAVARFRATYHGPLRYDIIGSLETDSLFVSALNARIRERGLGDIVTLRGSVDDAALEQAYAEADVFLLPSLHEGKYFEGFGLVFLEANARGVPVIGGNTGGSPEAIEEGKSGYLCNPTDIGAIASRLADILLHRAIDPQVCRAWAEEHDVRNSARILARLYSQETLC